MESWYGIDLQAVLVQNISPSCTAIAAFYHVASDRRRSRLLSCGIFGPLNDTGPASASKLAPADGSADIVKCDGDMTERD